MTGYLYGLGVDVPSDYAHTVVRDFRRWLATRPGKSRRARAEDELGRYLTYLLVVNGRDYVLSGLGDLAAAEAVMRTFRVLSGP